MRFALLAPSALLLVALTPALPAADSVKPDKADKLPKSERREMRKSGDTAAADEKRPAPSDLQARIQSRLRERLEITDDAEWAVIAERITRVEELRRAAASGPLATLDRAKRGGKGDSGGTEREALRAAIADQLPDAEIRSRLARVAEVQKQNQAKLARAQEELRAVLTVRQEAIAVMFGVLPP
jgi:hypothetical protein